MIIKKNINNNTYCIDYKNKYISLVNPLIMRESDDLNIEYNREDREYYYSKSNYLKEKLSLNNILSYDGRIKPESIKEQIINLKHLVFEVTEACNLKCKYCGYGEIYNDYDERSDKYMQFENIEPLLQYLSDIWAMNSPKSLLKVLISFYGGEPLLNIPLIKKIVLFFNSLKIPNRKFIFAMTTNAILLNKYIDFIVDNKFKLLISLDGNKYNHSYRININGDNSFDIVINNLDTLQKIYPNYFDEFIDFHAVLHDRNTVSSIYNFINNKYNKIPLISELSNTGIRDDKKILYSKMYNNRIKSMQYSNNFELEKKLFLNNPLIKDLAFFLRQYTFFFPKGYLDLFKKRILKYLPTGTCFPFSKKMFVTVNGKILPCERIGHFFYLGKIEEEKVDIDYYLISEKYNKYYEKLKKQCNLCYNKNNCTQCIFNIKNIENIENEDIFCRSYMNETEFANSFINKISYLEKHPTIYQKIINEADFE
jgi:uncharacterized protein